MLASIQTLSLAVASIERRNDWIVGTLHAGPTAPSPRAPWVSTHKALAKAIRDDTLPTTIGPFFLPLKSERGLFREVGPSILQEFLSIRRGNDDAIIHFVRAYGVFRLSDLEPKRQGMPKAVRAWWSTAKGQPYAFSISSFWDDCDKVDVCCQMAAAVLERDKAAAESSLQSFGQIGLVSGADTHKYTAPLYDAERLLAAAIAAGLATARFAPVDIQGKIAPGVVTGCVLDAVYVRLMELVTESNPLRRCARCAKAFVPVRSDQRYCSRPCQNLANRYRQLERESKGAKKQ
jgi:predicted nucleic acid-binding Zn ribbon protein